MTYPAPFYRKDGLAVFPDEGDAALNKIRECGTREEVIKAVAIRRAQQIALNYAARHAPDLYRKIWKAMNRKELPITAEILMPMPSPRPKVERLAR